MVSLAVKRCPCKNEEAMTTTTTMEIEEAVVHMREDNPNVSLSYTP